MDYYISKDPVAQQRVAEAAEMVEASTRAASQGKRLKRSRTLSKKAQEALEAKPTSQRGPRNPKSLWVRLNTQPPTYRHTKSGQVQVELPKEGWAKRVDLTSSSSSSSSVSLAADFPS